jgi:uncharacterized protein
VPTAERRCHMHRQRRCISFTSPALLALLLGLLCPADRGGSASAAAGAGSSPPGLDPSAPGSGPRAPGSGSADAGSGADSAYVGEVSRWRAAREANLRADGGWLTVAGLFWLKPGENRFGADPSDEVVLPPGSAPEQAGVFRFEGDSVRVSVLPGVSITLGGAPVTERTLIDDSDGEPDVLSLRRVTLQVIRRQDRLGIRLKDLDSVYRKQFTGLHWYPIDPRWRLTARFVPYDPPRKLSVPNILGQVSDESCPGYVVFTVDGKEHRLEPVAETGESELFFVFSDGTTGETTYPGGRFLVADPPKGGTVVLDFNRAYNPPCAFTPYATCPLPPASNRLEVAIPAGELSYGDHGGKAPLR